MHLWGLTEILQELEELKQREGKRNEIMEEALKAREQKKDEEIAHIKAYAEVLESKNLMLKTSQFKFLPCM